MDPGGMHDGRRPGTTADDQGRRCPRYERAALTQNGDSCRAELAYA
jgi:hypothetical protein